MLYPKTYTCRKCGKRFSKMVGGIVMSPKEQKLETYPVCDKCKLNTAINIFKVRK